MKYVLIEWPESQQFMEEEWFQTEAVLHPDLSATYFIPEERIINNEYIEQEVRLLSKQYKCTTDDRLHIENEWSEDVPFDGGMTLKEHILDININLL